ncbi:MAG: sugar ABC transporter substrate-binding protein [Gammaproteobacteria bacterium]|nr:sugar ABC transporter substrate-binding protein [Gammaproteobacteria bacterium]
MLWQAHDERSDGDVDIVEIEFWTMQLSPILDGYINSSITAFEQSHPHVNIKWVDVAWADMERKLLSSVAAGTAPDVANLNPQFASKLAEFNALEDPTRYLGAETTALYHAGVWRSNQLNGRYFGIPWYLSTSVAIYNTSIFDEANVPFPATLEDIIEIGGIIREKAGKYTYFPSFDGGEPMENYVLMGGDIRNDLPAYGLTDASVEKLLRYYAGLYESGAVPPSVLIEGHQKAVDLFQSGELAMLLIGMQMLHTIRLNAPELVADLVVRPHPNADQGRANIAAMNLVVPTQTQHPQEAFAFIVFITSPERQTEMARHVPIIPSTPSSLEDRFFDITDPRDNFEIARAHSIEQIRGGAVLLPPLTNYSRLRTAFIQHTQRAMLAEVSVEEGAKNLIDDWRTISRMSGASPN